MSTSAYFEFGKHEKHFYCNYDGGKKLQGFAAFVDSIQDDFDNKFEKIALELPTKTILLTNIRKVESVFNKRTQNRCDIDEEINIKSKQISTLDKQITQVYSNILSIMSISKESERIRDKVLMEFLYEIEMATEDWQKKTDYSYIYKPKNKIIEKIDNYGKNSKKYKLKDIV